MTQTTWVALLFGTWAALYLLDAFLKSQKWSSRIYTQFLNGTGLSISVLQLRWYTTLVNRLFCRIGHWHPKFWRIWFTAGVCFGLVAMMCSVCILTLLVVNTLGRQQVEQQVLTPVMPGVNLPMSQIAYYLLTLLVCGILHEVGHAVAAVREQVRVNGFGLFIMAIYPGAYVDLCTEHLQIISPIRQLRIFCAGVWHNFVIVIVALAVWFALPTMLAPFYTTHYSVVITSVVQGSPVSGPRGLYVGDKVTSISGCRITSMEEWSSCIQDSMKSPNTGYCMAVEQIKLQDAATHSYQTISGNMECCNRSNTHLCFAYHTKANPDLKYACLPARSTADRQPCRLQSDCFNPNIENVCVYPSLDNQTKLLRVSHEGRAPLLFLGYPPDLHYSVTISNYVPSYSLVPLNLPYMIETFCKYLVSLSGALALLNVVPCYALDGQWILLAFIELMFRSTIPDAESRGLIYTVVLFFGTILLGTNLVLAMWMLFS